MAGPADIPTPPSSDIIAGPAGAPAPGPAATTRFGRLIEALNGVGTVWIFALMVLINLDVFGRALFARPISGVPEMVEMSIVGIVFLQLAHTLKVGRITRSEAFFNRLLARRPRLGHGLGALYNLTGAMLFAAILYGSAPRLIRAWTEGHYVGNQGIFTAPVWPIKAIIGVGSAALIAQFLLLAWRELRQIAGRDGGPTPGP